MHTLTAPASPDDTTALPEAPEPECEHCDDGMVECSEDRFEPREGHYTRDWTEACPHCERGQQRAAEAA